MVCLDILLFVDELDIVPVCLLFNVWYTPGEWPVELCTPACRRGVVGCLALLCIAGLLCKA